MSPIIINALEQTIRAAFPNKDRSKLGISGVSKGGARSPKLIDLFDTGRCIADLLVKGTVKSARVE
jgi:hypothetical protein